MACGRVTGNKELINVGLTVIDVEGHFGSYHLNASSRNIEHLYICLLRQKPVIYTSFSKPWRFTTLLETDACIATAYVATQNDNFFYLIALLQQYRTKKTVVSKKCFRQRKIPLQQRLAGSLYRLGLQQKCWYCIWCLSIANWRLTLAIYTVL